VIPEFLEDSLDEIHRHGSKVISVVPDSFNINAGGPSTYYTSEVRSYCIIYYNPPLQGIPGTPGSNDPTTIQ
jgi:hypothetical protein